VAFTTFIACALPFFGAFTGGSEWLGEDPSKPGSFYRSYWLRIAQPPAGRRPPPLLLTYPVPCLMITWLLQGLWAPSRFSRLPWPTPF
jgi:hypothetical protein